MAKPDGEYAELSKLSGMANSADNNAPADEHALSEVIQLVATELERDPGSTFLQGVKAKLASASALMFAERRRLKELTATYEHALEEYSTSHDAAHMQAEVEQHKTRTSWATLSGVSTAKFKFLRFLHKSDLKGVEPGPPTSSSSSDWKSIKAMRRDMTLDEVKADLLAPLPVSNPGLQRAETSY